MTCIVGVKCHGEVMIGADTMGSNNHGKTNYKNSKIICSTNNDILIGYTSSYRMGQLIAVRINEWVDWLPLFPVASNDEEYARLLDTFITRIIPDLRKTLKEGGYSTIDNNVETGGTFLIAVKGCLYTVQNDFAIMETKDNYDACGSGENFALGSLHTTDGLDMSLQEKIEAALEAATAHCVSVGFDFVFARTRTHAYA